MRALLAEPDEVKAEALPRLLHLAGAQREDVRLAAFQTLDALHFLDARSAWGVSARQAGTCPKVVKLTRARWADLLPEQRDGLLAAVVAGPCKERDAWLWELVEAGDATLRPGSTLYGWADTQRAPADSDRLVKLALAQEGPGQVATLCELLAARDLEGGERYGALKLVDNPWAPLSVRLVLGERLLRHGPPLDEPSLHALVRSAMAPSELRKAAFSALAGDAPQLTARLLEDATAVLGDPFSPPDARSWFAERLAGRQDEAVFAVLRTVAQDESAPRDLRAAMLAAVAGFANDAASRVLATVVRQEDSPMETRASALAAMAGVWSTAAETTCVELCARRPFSELCAGALKRLAEHGSSRLPQARAFGLVERLKNAEDPATILSIRRELDDATLAVLPDQTRAFVVAVGGLFEADGVYFDKLGERFAELEEATCTMREGWEKVNAHKAAGEAEQAHEVQRLLYRADNLLRADPTRGLLAAAGRAAAPALQASAAAAAQLVEEDLVERARRMREKGGWLRAPCLLLPAFERAVRSVPPPEH